MQNRYVGDVGDFAKYSLLRRLSGELGEHPVRIGVVWCLFPDESHNNDGRHITYLRDPAFQSLDSKLISMLRYIIESGRRSISVIGSSGILPRGTIFCGDTACLPNEPKGTCEDRLSYRAAWLTKCLALTKTTDLVFFDPDNGIEVASIPKRHPKAGKYIYLDEIAPFWRRGQALMIYHHLNRTKPVTDQVEELLLRIRANFRGAIVRPLVFRRGSCRVFWLVYRRSVLGAELARRADEFLSGGWAEHFRVS
jgi:hypothetical protein